MPASKAHINNVFVFFFPLELQIKYMHRPQLNLYFSLIAKEFDISAQLLLRLKSKHRKRKTSFNYSILSQTSKPFTIMYIFEDRYVCKNDNLLLCK